MLRVQREPSPANPRVNEGEESDNNNSDGDDDAEGQHRLLTDVLKSVHAGNHVHLSHFSNAKVWNKRNTEAVITLQIMGLFSLAVFAMVVVLLIQAQIAHTRINDLDTTLATLIAILANQTTTAGIQ